MMAAAVLVVLGAFGFGAGKMKYAVIENDKVVNIAESDSAIEGNWVPHQAGVRLGWGWDGSKFVSPENAKTVADFKRIARDRLEATYKEHLEVATIGGMKIESIISDIFKADAVISAGASNFAVVSGGDSQLLNAAKLEKIKMYWNDCSQTAITHYTNIQGLTTKAEIKVYVQLNLKTLWPDPNL